MNVCKLFFKISLQSNNLYIHRFRIPILYRSISNNIESLNKSNVTYAPEPYDNILESTDKHTDDILRTGIEVYLNFITEDEEKSMYSEIHNYIRRLRYEKNHWDDVSLTYLVLVYRINILVNISI